MPDIMPGEDNGGEGEFLGSEEIEAADTGLSVVELGCCRITGGVMVDEEGTISGDMSDMLVSVVDAD